jgi:metal-responsive CopG/Arc/MetJ family transcriptional regulator
MTFICQHCNATVKYALAIAIDNHSKYYRLKEHLKTETWCLGCIIEEGKTQETKNITERLEMKRWNS